MAEKKKKKPAAGNCRQRKTKGNNEVNNKSGNIKVITNN